jgi:hypothetical protein
MLHVDIPSRSDIQRLSAVRTPSCLSIYLPTTPITQDAQADRIALKNLLRQGLEQLTERGIAKRDRDAIDEALTDRVDDDGAVHFDAAAAAGSHGVVDQIASRALASGARVLGVRRADMPGGGSLAAILRYAF